MQVGGQLTRQTERSPGVVGAAGQEKERPHPLVVPTPGRGDPDSLVVAGSGDQARNMIEMAASLGIGHTVLFTGFLRGNGGEMNTADPLLFNGEREYPGDFDLVAGSPQRKT